MQELSLNYRDTENQQSDIQTGAKSTFINVLSVLVILFFNDKDLFELLYSVIGQTVLK